MPADPGKDLGAKRLPTKPEDMGHFAPSFETPESMNTLVIRPEYRISLRMGKIEELCRYPANSERGRMERLQVLGLFYFPLAHSRALTAFRGIPAQNATGAWSYFKSNVFNNVADAKADEEIQKRLTEWVVDGGKLPEEAADPKKPDKKKNFAKLRLPGGYSFISDNFGRNLNNDAAYASGFGQNPYPLETLYYRDNPVLGKIPLIATVEKKDAETNKWKPAKDAQVYFQLQPTYDLPAFDPAANVHEQLNRPPIRQSTLGPPSVANGKGPNIIISREEAPTGGRAYNADDPQKGNVPKDRGGKQGDGSLNDGTDVANVIFSTDEYPGFNKAYEAVGANPARSDDKARTKFFPVAKSESSADRKHCVKAKTNDEGEAGVLFMPSRCGGDRYRIRAFLGPDTMKGPGKNGEGAEAVRVDTGTFVLWRNLRISRYIRQPVNNPAAPLLAEVNNANYNITSNNAYLQRAFVVDSTGTNKGLATADFSGTGTANANFNGIRLNWARAFVEVVIDRAAQGSLPATMTQAQWQAAVSRAISDAQAGQAAQGTNLNLQTLFHATTAAINVNNAVCHLPMRTWQAYNAAVPAAQQIVAGNVGNGINNVDNLVTNYAIPGFLRALTSTGFEPGLTVVQGGYGYTWQVIGSSSNFSGLAVNYRGCFVWAGADAYPTAFNVPNPAGNPWMCYGYTSNTCHELGHCCYRQHAPGPFGANAPGGFNAARHDPHAAADTNDSVCVMSYQGCEGQFCAKCLLSFRGWDGDTVP